MPYRTFRSFFDWTFSQEVHSSRMILIGIYTVYQICYWSIQMSWICWKCCWAQIQICDNLKILYNKAATKVLLHFVKCHFLTWQPKLMSELQRLHLWSHLFLWIDTGAYTVLGFTHSRVGNLFSWLLMCRANAERVQLAPIYWRYISKCVKFAEESFASRHCTMG